MMMTFAVTSAAISEVGSPGISLHYDSRPDSGSFRFLSVVYIDPPTGGMLEKVCLALAGARSLPCDKFHAIFHANGVRSASALSK